MRITFGRYIPINSIMHKMDPRIKLFSIIFFIVSIFFSLGFSGFMIAGTTIALIFISSRLPYKMLLRLLIPVTFMFIIILLMNGFFIHPKEDNGVVVGKEFLNLGNIFILSEKSIYMSLYMGIRIYIMILLTSILTATTQPLELTLAIEDLLSPLKIIRVPVYILSMIISIALRMIPTLIDEAGRIMKAQASRGIDMKNGHGKDKAKALTSLIIPLLVSSFQKAEDLAYAMDARGYDPYAKRTRYSVFKFNWIDWAFLSLTCTIALSLILYATGVIPLTHFSIDQYVINWKPVTNV